MDTIEKWQPVDVETGDGLVVRRCRLCRQQLPLESFGKDRSRPRGHNYECKPCRAARYRTGGITPHRRDPEQQRRWRLKSEFGITPEEYDRLLAEQGGRCAVCRQECASGRRLAVDHCHTTAKVRGLLCTRCNVGLGMFRDDSDLMLAACQYLTGQSHLVQ